MAAECVLRTGFERQVHFGISSVPTNFFSSSYALQVFSIEKRGLKNSKLTLWTTVKRLADTVFATRRLLKNHMRFGCRTSESRQAHPRALSLYDLLEISEDVGLTEIKAAYRQLALRYHPDVCRPDERDKCVTMFLKVQEAYDTLRDPNLRANYDFRLRNPMSVQAMSVHGTERFDKQGEVPMEEWKAQWKSQINELKAHRPKGNSWAARVRKQQGK